MGFDWTEYLILAQFLQGKGNRYSKEAARRAAVSRAYYAAFCLARNYASTNLQFVPEGKGVDHGDLISWYNVCENYHPSLLGIGEKLRELLIWRNTCDYDDEPEILTSLELLVDSAIIDAQDIINSLN